MIYSTLVLLAAAGAQAFNVPTPFASVVRTSPVRMMAVPDATVLDAAQSTIESELSVLQLQIEASKVKTQMAELRLEELKAELDKIHTEAAAALKDLQEAGTELATATATAVPATPVPVAPVVDAAEVERQALIAKIAELEAAPAVPVAVPEVAPVVEAAPVAAAAFDLDPAPAMEAAAAVSESTAAVQETATALQEAAVAAGDAGDATPLLLFAGTALVLSSEMLKLVNTPRSGIDRTDALPSFGSLAANAAKSSQSPGERSALDIFYGGLANLEKDGFQHEFDGPPSALYSNVATTTAGGEATTTTSTPFAPAAVGTVTPTAAAAASMGKKPRMGAKELAKEAARRAAAAEAEKAAEAAAAEQEKELV